MKSKGVILIAHNSPNTNYYEIACFTAQRVKKFLNLPVTLITDKESVQDKKEYFDKIIFTSIDDTNSKNNKLWLNKGRYKVYELSPYDETLLLDVDYIINSPKLNELFDFDTDFMCFKNTFILLNENQDQEKLSKSSLETLWATVIKFKKTNRVKQIFNMVEMVQNNYYHYSQIYGFLPMPYRNDYALTIAVKTVNGHLENAKDYIPWSLVHIDEGYNLEYINDTSYKVSKIINQKNYYIEVTNKDFHVIDKLQLKNIIV